MAKTKVKAYYKNGKLVKQHDRNLNKVKAATLLGAGATGLGTGLAVSRLLKGKTSPADRAALSAQLGFYGAALGAAGGQQLGRKVFLDKKERKVLEKQETARLKQYVPYQDRDISALSGAINTGSTAAAIGGAGYLIAKRNKLAKLVKSEQPNSQLLKKLSAVGIGRTAEGNLVPDLRRLEADKAARYWRPILRRAGKVAIVSGLLGAGLGAYNARRNADKLNKRLGKQNSRETTKQRAAKIIKAVGAAGLGASALYLAGRGLGKAQLQNARAPFVSNLNRLNEVQTQARLRGAAQRTVEEFQKAQKNNPGIKLLGDAPTDVTSEMLLREQFKRKGEKAGRYIAKRAANSNRAINKLSNMFDPELSRLPHWQGLLLAPTGATVGLGLYNKSRSKKDKKK